MPMIKFSVGSISKVIVQFFKKINAPYRLTVVNEESMSEALVVHLTKKSVYIFVSTILVGLFLLLSMLILFTPLRFYIPGNSNDVTRKELVKMRHLSDSLVKINNLREQYIFNLIQVAKGDISNTLDTNALTTSQIEQAIQSNNGKIDKASKYDYLKTQKKDTSQSVKNMGTKDSL